MRETLQGNPVQPELGSPSRPGEIADDVSWAQDSSCLGIMNRAILRKFFRPIRQGFKSMPKDVSSLQFALNERPPRTTLTRWLYQELRRAILDRHLPRGMRLPATRD